MENNSQVIGRTWALLAAVIVGLLVQLGSAATQGGEDSVVEDRKCKAASRSGTAPPLSQCTNAICSGAVPCPSPSAPLTWTNGNCDEEAETQCTWVYSTGNSIVRLACTCPCIFGTCGCVSGAYTFDTPVPVTDCL